MINWHVWTDAFDIANQHSVSAAHSFGCHHSNTPGPNRFDSCPVLSVQIEPDLEHMCSTSEAPNGIDIHVLHILATTTFIFFLLLFITNSFIACRRQQTHTTMIRSVKRSSFRYRISKIFYWLNFKTKTKHIFAYHFIYREKRKMERRKIFEQSVCGV